MTEREWLDGLKAGDEVNLRGSFERVGCIASVERVTATQIVLAGRGGRYRRKNGRLVGGTGWGVPSIHEATPEVRAKVWRANAERRLGRCQWHALTDDQIARVLAIVDETRANGSEVEP